MARRPLSDNPHLLGFDHFDRVLDRIAKTSDEGYPPYNIEQIGEIGLRITLAVAGFEMDCLQVSVEDNQLIIRGRHTEEDRPDRVFLHHGIVPRQFLRAFVLAEGIEVRTATLDNGLLHIDLRRSIPATQVRNVRITPSTATQNHSVETDLQKAGETAGSHSSVETRKKIDIAFAARGRTSVRPKAGPSF